MARATAAGARATDGRRPRAARLSEVDRAAWDVLQGNAEGAARLNQESATVHAQASEHYEQVHTNLGIALIVLTALTSASLLQAIGETEQWQKLLAAGLSALATACAALQTFLRAADKSKAHDRSARGFLAVTGELMGFLIELSLVPKSERCVTDAQRKALLETDRHRRLVDEEAPRLPRRQQQQYDAFVAAEVARLDGAERLTGPAAPAATPKTD